MKEMRTRMRMRRMRQVHVSEEVEVAKEVQ